PKLPQKSPYPKDSLIADAEEGGALKAAKTRERRGRRKAGAATETQTQRKKASAVIENANAEEEG
ncbi:unnamed protein product, partial [Citrullus colocynthis]